MAWGEVHFATGVAIQQASEGNPWGLPVAVVLAALSHWPLDDLNIGRVARVYHGIGRSWLLALGTVARICVIGALVYISWNEPKFLIGGLVAWLILDHILILNLVGRLVYGLHQRMWRGWLQGVRGLIPWLIVMGLLMSLIW